VLHVLELLTLLAQRKLFGLQLRDLGLRFRKPLLVAVALTCHQFCRALCRDLLHAQFHGSLAGYQLGFAFLDFRGALLALFGLLSQQGPHRVDFMLKGFGSLCGKLGGAARGGGSGVFLQPGQRLDTRRLDAFQRLLGEALLQ
jgi:hypothetical protein